jgi:hypothetical protein
MAIKASGLNKAIDKSGQKLKETEKGVDEKLTLPLNGDSVSEEWASSANRRWNADNEGRRRSREEPMGTELFRARS